MNKCRSYLKGWSKSDTRCREFDQMMVKGLQRGYHLGTQVVEEIFVEKSLNIKHLQRKSDAAEVIIIIKGTSG